MAILSIKFNMSSKKFGAANHETKLLIKLFFIQLPIPFIINTILLSYVLGAQ